MRDVVYSAISKTLTGVLFLGVFEIGTMGVATAALSRSADYEIKAFNEIPSTVNGNKERYEEFSRRAKTYETLAEKIKGFAETIGPCSNTKKLCVLLEDYLFN